MKRLIVATAGLLVTLLLLVPLGASVASASLLDDLFTPTLTWTPQSVTVYLHSGESEVVPVAFTSSRDIAHPTFEAEPPDGSVELAGTPASIVANQKYTINITVTLRPADASQSAVFSVVRVLDGEQWVSALQVITVVQDGATGTPSPTDTPNPTATPGPTDNLVPAVSDLTPAWATVGGPDFTLDVRGSHFINESIVQWNGSPCPTTYVSASEVTAQITASDIASAGSARVTVCNPAPGGGCSSPVRFAIAPRWDVNADFVTNILDLIAIGHHWGETGAPGWIAEDVNADGRVNFLDAVTILGHWLESYRP
jgi:hypothetical protein